MNTKEILRQAVASVGIQYVYVMGVWPEKILSANWHWHGKVGLTSSPMQRRADVEASIRRANPNLNIYCLPLPVLAAAPIEKAAHIALNPISSNPFPGTNGGTEWFRSFNVLVGVAAFLWGFANGMDVKPLLEWSVLICLIPIPLDLALIVLALAAIHWGLIAATCYTIASLF